MIRKNYIFALSIIASSTHAQTSTIEIDLDACYGDEYFYLEGVLTKYDPELHLEVDNSTQFIYRNEERISHFYSNHFRGTNIYIRNISNQPVNFFYVPTQYSDSTGLEININNFGLRGNFSSSNSPLNVNGAHMYPNTAGRISNGTSGTPYYGQASIYWQTDRCLESAPIMASVESYAATSSAHGISIQFINDGNPW